MDNPPDDGPCEVTITAPDRDWLETFAGQLVEERLAAASHIDVMQTTYRWKGQVHRAEEARARLHTRFASVPAITERVRAEHPYEVPCVVASQLQDGEPKYLRWILEETKEPNKRAAKAGAIETVRSWLIDSGYPLEMRVAEALRAADPLIVSQGDQYVDASTQAVREIDVTALWMNLTEEFLHLGLNIVVECKTGTQPWIVFADKENEAIGFLEYMLDVAASAKPDNEELVELVTEHFRKSDAPLFNGHFLSCYGIAQMKTRSKGSERDEAYDALRQAASAAQGTVQSLQPNSDPPGLTYAVPVLVTTHPLFAASLNNEGDLEVEEVSAASIPVTLKSNAEQLLVHVVAEHSMAEFIELCRRTGAAVDGAPLPSEWSNGDAKEDPK